MRTFRIISSLFAVLIISCAQPLLSQGNPFNADMVVAADGSGDFTSIQEAINAVPSNSVDRTVIYIKRGLYDREKLIVPYEKKNITIIGESREETIISYHIYDCTSGGLDGKCPAESAALWTGDNIRTSATLTIQGDGFRAENLTIENTAGPVGQALAITVQADRVVFINVDFKSYQDTIYLWTSGKRTYFENCLVVGRTDYIYGAGIAFFQGSEIRSWGGGWITAPATPQDQAYGFVFNECDITYALNSPRAGDDGATVALGRPWHEYPKVAWLYCDMTDMIDPLGWPTKWNMDYADISPDLHLYEYKNTGGGADMSGRADWVGIRALSDAEAADYTVQKVMAGTDNWDPTAEAPAVTVYEWTGMAAGEGWFMEDNWLPVDTPKMGESAVVDSAYVVQADGGNFEADLTLRNGAILELTASSSVTYLAAGQAEISSSSKVSLAGKIRTKDTIYLSSTDTLTIAAVLIGVHDILKKKAGTVIITGNNQDFSGTWVVIEGSLVANSNHSLGKGGAQVQSGASLSIMSEGALHPSSPLRVSSGSFLTLHADVTLSEFYIDGVLQTPGEYNASSNPGLIEGTGKIIVGRPSSFQFIGGENGNWDNPAHFIPALFPLAGETVYVESEIETTSTVFEADMIVSGGGKIRLRGVHKCTGTITMGTGTKLAYATSGPGFSLEAPIILEGDILAEMNSRNTPTHSLTLPGTMSGSHKVSVMNKRTDTENTGILVLSGDNSGFSGTWDLTLVPGHANSVNAIEGKAENSLGQGKFEIDNGNLLILTHPRCAGDILNVSMSGPGRILLNDTIMVKDFLLNDISQSEGIYDASTHPAIFDGEGVLFVRPYLSVQEIPDEIMIHVTGRQLIVNGPALPVSVYDIRGSERISPTMQRRVSLESLEPGIYVVRYLAGERPAALKVLVD
jgi:pectin methylesterase-like acyl-CoA thioesterase